LPVTRRATKDKMLTIASKRCDFKPATNLDGVIACWQG
jgi:hypothetical protein